MKSFISLFLVAVVFMVTNGCGYNSMQAKEEQVFSQWANVEASYQRRADLIPSLVEVVKGYATHERETLVQISQARASVGSIKLDANSLKDPSKIAAYQAQQQTLGTALSRLMSIQERYPELKAHEGFRDLQAQLEGTENRINTERVRYNRLCSEFNVAIRTFPNNMTNNFILHLERKVPFKSEDTAKVAPKVNFGK